MLVLQRNDLEVKNLIPSWAKTNFSRCHWYSWFPCMVHMHYCSTLIDIRILPTPHCVTYPAKSVVNGATDVFLTESKEFIFFFYVTRGYVPLGKCPSVIGRQQVF